MIKKILVSYNDVIVDIADSYTVSEETGYILMNGVFYPEGTVYEVDIAEDIVPSKYCYSLEKGIYLNQRWVQLSSTGKILELQQVIDALLGGETV